MQYFFHVKPIIFDKRNGIDPPQEISFLPLGIIVFPRVKFSIPNLLKDLTVLPQINMYQYFHKF